MPVAALRQPIVGLGLLGGLLTAVAFAAPNLLPDDDPADVVTRQTARVAVSFWSIGAAAILLRRLDVGRSAWTVGAATFLIHVATAFDRVHGWSHAAAFRHVQSVSGVGPGIYVSYAFTLVWTADAAWWWLDRGGYESRSAVLDRAVQAFLAIVVFNGTVVYETGFIRWASCALFSILGLLLLRRILVRVTAAA
jgi:hypothetical protein